MYGKLGKKITNEEFDKRLDETNFKRLDDYINTNTTIRFECILCNKIIKSKPKEIKSKLVCRCEEKHNEYCEDIKEKEVIPLEKYKSIRTKIKHKCLNCGDIFTTTPKSIKTSLYGCPSCAGKKFSKKTYESKLPKDIILLDDEYKGSLFKHKHKCLNCENIWETKPNYILHMNTGCPSCSSSKGEKKISEYLNKIGLSFQKEYSVKIGGKSFRYDFYIPVIDLLIEYDGVQHFEPIEYFGGQKHFDKIIESDEIKDKWASENNKTLLRISYLDDINYVLNCIFFDEE